MTVGDVKPGPDVYVPEFWWDRCDDDPDGAIVLEADLLRRRSVDLVLQLRKVGCNAYGDGGDDYWILICEECQTTTEHVDELEGTAAFMAHRCNGQARRLGDWPAGSREWHAARARGIGGSEVAPVLGLSPWTSRFALWHAKAGTIDPAPVDSPEVEWGTRLEHAVLTKFADNHPELDLDVDCGTWCHVDRPWQIANPDALAYGPGPGIDSLVEAKTARWDDGWGEPGTDEIPVYYRTQALWYLDTLGAERCHVAVLIGGSDYREYLVTYDAAEAAWIRGEVQAFLESIDAGDQPDLDAHTATYVALRQLHPEIDDVAVDVPDELAVDWITARTAVKAAEAAEQAAKNRLADHMGTARRALWRGRPIASRQAKATGAPYVVAARNLPTVDDLVGTDAQENPAA